METLPFVIKLRAFGRSVIIYEQWVIFGKCITKLQSNLVTTCTKQDITYNWAKDDEATQRQNFKATAMAVIWFCEKRKPLATASCNRRCIWMVVGLGAHEFWVILEMT